MRTPQDVYRLHDVNDLLVEGGSATATAFLAEDLVDRILIYRAPIIVGEGKSSFGYVGLDAIADAHGRWRLVDEQRLGVDRLEVYERVRGLGAAMFTGIVTDVGTVRSAEQRGDLRLTIAYRLRPRQRRSRRLDRLLGRVPDGGRQGRRTGSRSTSRAKRVSRTAPDRWREGARLNLERSLRLGDELGGHIVTGHVDAVGEVVDGRARRRFDARSGSACRASSAPMIAPKGSIALDGVSLTVNEVRRCRRRHRISPSTSSRTPRSTRRLADSRRTTAQCRDRRARPLYRPNARRSRTVGTSLFLLFITLRCDIAAS